MHDAASYQISVSTLPFPRSSRPPPSPPAFRSTHAPPSTPFFPPLDISDSKHNSNPGGLYARRGNSSVATQSSSLIEISYPLTYLPNPPSRICLASARPNIPNTSDCGSQPLHVHGIIPLPFTALSIPIEFIGKLFTERMAPLPGVRSTTSYAQSDVARNAYAKQQSILKVAERSRESEGKFTVPKEVCEVRRCCTWTSAPSTER